MARVIITAKVDDIDKWEKGFRTHGALFKDQGVASPVLIGISDDNEVALYEEIDDLDTVTTPSPETIEAMAQDGVRQDSMKMFVLDKDFTF